MNSTTVTAARVGMWSSAITGLITLLFAFLLNVPYWDCFICMPLAISYIFITIGNKYTVTGGKIVFADATVVLAAIYCTCGSIVYFVQISFVRLADASPEALSVVQQYPPSAFFAIDMLAYTFLGISTVFLAISLNDNNKILKVLCMLNGAAAIVGFCNPLMTFVYESANENDTTFNVILYGWCALFIPICILLWNHFYQMLKIDNEHMERRAGESKGGPHEEDFLLGKH